MAITIKEIENQLEIALETSGAILPVDRNLAYRMVKVIAPAVYKIVLFEIRQSKKT